MSEAKTSDGGLPEPEPEIKQSLPFLKQKIIDTASNLESIPQQIRTWQYEGEDSLIALGSIVRGLRDAQEHLMVAKLRFDLKLPPPTDVDVDNDSSLTTPFHDLLREMGKERDEWGDYADLEVLGALLHRMVSLDPRVECAEELVYESARSVLWFKNNGFPSEVTRPLSRFWDEAVKEANNYPQRASVHHWPAFRPSARK